MAETKYRYEELSWPEIKEAAAAGTVVLLPFAAIEDHGYHLPVGTDAILARSYCYEAAKRAPGEILVLPPLPYGLDDHHMDFPGPICVPYDILIKLVGSVAVSAARHGFKKIIIVNGHGSNAPIADLAARNATLESDSLVASVSSPFALAKGAIKEHRKSEPGGIAHAGECETAIMLHLKPDLVAMDKAVKETGQFVCKYFSWDHPTERIYSIREWWSRLTKSGVCGDPTVATEEFGKLCFDKAVETLLEIVREFRELPIRERTDYH